MSASKKLRALGPPFDLTETHSWIEVGGVMREVNSMVALYDALPQIIAMVEAAEIVGQWPPENRYDFPPLRSALAALDEALS